MNKRIRKKHLVNNINRKIELSEKILTDAYKYCMYRIDNIENAPMLYVRWRSFLKAYNLNKRHLVLFDNKKGGILYEE